MFQCGAVLLVALACGVAALDDSREDKEFEQFHVVYEWYKLDFAWPDDSSKARALSTQQFVPENNAISGLKVFKDRVYLTVPRFKEGVPATLVSIAANSNDKNASPKLEPFPSWAMQQVGNCSALQFVQNVEIDVQGRMWILDTGRINIMGRSEAKCPPKLVLIDLNTVSNTNYNTYQSSTTRYPTTFSADFDPTTSYAGTNNFNNQGLNNQGNTYNSNPSGFAVDLGSSYENNSPARVIRTFQFPDNVVSAPGSYLADLVLDPSDGWYAYITDGGDADPGIIVYSFLENRAWKVRDNPSMKADPTTREFQVNGDTVEILQNVSPLALDVKRQQVFYSPLSSINLYSIPTKVLKDETKAKEASKYIRDIGKKLGLSEGFAMDDQGVLYYGLINDNGIAKWDTSMSFQDGQHVISKDAVRLQWPTNFGFDDNGYLWLVSNRMQNYIAGRVNLNEPNYRVIRGLTGTKSYLHTQGAGQSDNWSVSMSTKSTDFEDNTSRLSSSSQNDTRNGAGAALGLPAALLGGLLLAMTLA